MIRVRVLMVCTGNICRSPMAQGVLERHLRAQRLDDQVEVDSAGTHDYHIAHPPDSRAIATARRREVEIAHQRARVVKTEDFADFHYILAMDSGHLRWLQDKCPPFYVDRLKLLLDFAPERRGLDVPDPYYGAPEAFAEVLDLVEPAVGGLVDELMDKLRDERKGEIGGAL